jgi:2-dehydro-3-deoxyglucarate aldolase/4-hydroxy-2-oxoheptanedioate aldolase
LTKKSVRQRALSGETILGAMIFEFFVPGMPQMLRNSGAEYAIYDMEHGGLGLETLKMLAAASRGTGVVPMVRVPRGEYHFIARALDVGAQGVMIPMVETVEQARGIANSARYPRKGRRGAAFGFAHDNYEPGDPQSKMEEADLRNLVIAQIETEKGLEAVEEIAAVEGIDCLWLGHFDLSNFLGIPGQFNSPVFTGAVARIVAAGRKHGKALGYMAADADLARQYRKLGFNMIASGTDQGLLMAGIRTILQSAGDKG